MDRELEAIHTAQNEFLFYLSVDILGRTHVAIRF
jgi:hypothetical protein